MFASWPMVIGALIAGVLMGIMVPSPKTGSPVTPPLVSPEKSEAKAKRDLAAVTSKESGPAKEVNEARTVATTEVKVAKQDANPCSQQTWPYYSPSCIDRTAPAPATFQVTNTRPADPAIALREEKKQATAPKATPTAPTQAAAPAQAASPPASTQATPPAQATTTTHSAPPAQSQAAARASSRAPDNAQASSADVERQVEQPRQRQQQRGQPRYTRIEPPDDDDDYDSPRVRLRRDGTRVYVLPDGRAPRGYWRSW
jgi:hypothetical protein